jgi:hypothetical protein
VLFAEMAALLIRELIEGMQGAHLLEEVAFTTIDPSSSWDGPHHLQELVFTAVSPSSSWYGLRPASRNRDSSVCVALRFGRRSTGPCLRILASKSWTAFQGWWKGGD